jgi:uncharacterized protein (TIGR03086 family)
MTEIADRYRNVASAFTRRVEAVPAASWDAPAPCEGWRARDVVGHLVEWVPPLIAAGTGIALPEGPSVEDDPAGAWNALDAGVQALLDDPATAGRTFEHPQAGRHRLEDAIGMFVLGDVLVHTWDLARATGQDERLDADEVAMMFAGMEPLDDVLRASGHYGPKVEVSPDADVQTKLLAFTGRRP